LEIAMTTSVASGLRFDGVNASMALPMTDSFDPDYPALKRYARWLADQGVLAVTVNADTGEGAHLSTAERLRVIDTVKSELAEDIYVASGLIAAHTSQAVELAHDLCSAGADALLIFGIPAFNGHPLPAELVYGYYQSLSDVGLPLIGFHLTPALGGVIFEPEIIAALAAVDNLVALKDASFDATTYVRTRDALHTEAPHVALLSGCDNFMYESFVLGAHGALLGYAGLAADLTRRVFDAVANGDVAHAHELNDQRMQPLAEVLFGNPVRNSRARIKEGLRLLGIIEHNAVRPPLLALDETEKRRLTAAMTTAGLL
jgi:dihydrodipicolinate synthase/N-acetylneuraminate lyase